VRRLEPMSTKHRNGWLASKHVDIIAKNIEERRYQGSLVCSNLNSLLPKVPFCAGESSVTFVVARNHAVKSSNGGSVGQA
jgi:hypothetical protein